MATRSRLNLSRLVRAAYFVFFFVLTVINGLLWVTTDSVNPLLLLAHCFAYLFSALAAGYYYVQLRNNKE